MGFFGNEVVFKKMLRFDIVYPGKSFLRSEKLLKQTQQFYENAIISSLCRLHSVTNDV